MKKLTTYFSMTIIALASVTLLSCNSKNSDPEPTDGRKDIQYTIYKMNDLHLVADISVTYVDGAGKSITEPVTTTPWVKEVKGITPPFNAKMTVDIKRKDGIKYDRTSYKFSTGISILKKNSSEIKYEGGLIHSKETELPAGLVETTLKRYEKNPIIGTLEIPVSKSRL